MNKHEAEKLFELNFNLLFDKSDLPERARSPIDMKNRKTDREAWEYLEEVREDIVGVVNDGINIMIASSETGNGKTTWALRLGARFLAEMAIGSGAKTRVKYTTVPKLFSRLGSSISVKDEGLKDYLKELREVDLLILDDFGAGSLNKQTYNVLYEIIDERVSFKRSIIYTTNYNEDELQELLGKRLYSRTVNLSDWVEFTASDARGREVGDLR